MTNKKLTFYLALALISIFLLGVSNIYLWKDRAEVWQAMELQSLLLKRLYDPTNGRAPFVYEDEIPGTFDREIDTELLVSTKTLVLQVD